jgi:hypothetical protein
MVASCFMQATQWLRKPCTHGAFARSEWPCTKFFMELMKTRRLAVILAALLSALLRVHRRRRTRHRLKSFHLMMGLECQSVQRREVRKMAARRRWQMNRIPPGAKKVSGHPYSPPKSNGGVWPFRCQLTGIEQASSRSLLSYADEQR